MRDTSVPSAFIWVKDGRATELHLSYGQVGDDRLRARGFKQVPLSSTARLVQTVTAWMVDCQPVTQEQMAAELAQVAAHLSSTPPNGR